MVEEFISTLPQGNTRKTYARYAAKFVEWLGQDRLDTLEPGDVLSYIAWLREEGFAPSSINLMLSTVRELLRWAALTGKVKLEVFTAAQVVKNVKETDTLPVPFTPAQADRLLAAPDITTLDGARDLAIIKLGLATGLRVSELSSTNIETLDWERRRFIVTGKGNKQRVVFFNDDAAAALVYYLGLRGSPSTGALFENQAGARLSNRWVQKMLASYGQQAGIEGLHPHTLRHTFATELLDRTGDLALVQDLLGHSDPATTRIYTRLAVGRQERAYNEAMNNGGARRTEREVSIDLRSRKQPVPAGPAAVLERPGRTLGVS